MIHTHAHTHKNQVFQSFTNYLRKLWLDKRGNKIERGKEIKESRRTRRREEEGGEGKEIKFHCQVLVETTEQVSLLLGTCGL